MELKLIRKIKKNNCTIGELFIENKFICNTLEDVDRGLTDNMSIDYIKSKKIYGETAIPAGTYNITMDIVSPKFKDRQWAKSYKGKLPRLLNVKGFDGVLIHVGNTAKDSLGCILVGTYDGNASVLKSRESFDKLMSVILQDPEQKKEIKIVIE